MKWSTLACFTFRIGFWGGAPSAVTGQSQGSGGETESFEAIVQLKEGPKVVKTPMQSQYCAVTIHWSQSSGPKVYDAPTSSLGACAVVAPPPMGGANWNSGGSCKRFRALGARICLPSHFFYSLFHPCIHTTNRN